MRWCIRVINVVRTQIWCPFVPPLPRHEKKNKCRSCSVWQIFFSYFWSLDGHRFVYFLVILFLLSIQKGWGGTSARADQYLEKIRLHCEADGYLRRTQKIFGTSVSLLPQVVLFINSCAWYCRAAHYGLFAQKLASLFPTQQFCHSSINGTTMWLPYLVKLQSQQLFHLI